MNLDKRIYKLYKKGYYPKIINLYYKGMNYTYDLIKKENIRNGFIYNSTANILEDVDSNEFKSKWAEELKIAYLECLFKEQMGDIIDEKT